MSKAGLQSSAYSSTSLGWGPLEVEARPGAEVVVELDARFREMLLVSHGTTGDESERTTDGSTGGLTATRGGTSDLRRENRGILLSGSHRGGDHGTSLPYLLFGSVPLCSSRPRQIASVPSPPPGGCVA